MVLRQQDQGLMTIQGDSVEQTVETGDDWLELEQAPSDGIIVAWCENHPGLSLLAANLLLWGAVVCGFHFG